MRIVQLTHVVITCEGKIDCKFTNQPMYQLLMPRRKAAFLQALIQPNYHAFAQGLLALLERLERGLMHSAVLVN
jgi:hypothetical protein